jgi:hypothetical protein
VGNRKHLDLIPSNAKDQKVAKFADLEFSEVPFEAPEDEWLAPCPSQGFSESFFEEDRLAWIVFFDISSGLDTFGVGFRMQSKWEHL